MYIIPIAWMYVVVLMAATESSVLASVSTLFLYGVFPCSILMYILTAPRRAQLRRARESLDQLPEPTQTNQHSSDPNSVTPPAQSPSQNAPKAD